MKLFQIMLFIAICFAVACNNNPEQSSSLNDDSRSVPENKIMIPNMVCYSGSSGKDTVFLKLEKFPNAVTGSLLYNFFEKDKSSGDIDGRLDGDMLIADYTFMSEGKQSTRQVAFLIQNSMATEGYGPVEEKEGKMVFTNLAEIDFSKGIQLHQITCPVE
ncbi:MAG TPA: hypothetical protein VFV68_05145 [Agriterribacter sp.]|nr:hypothetical protein [Agriterribacter sp.]